MIKRQKYGRANPNLLPNSTCSPTDSLRKSARAEFRVIGDIRDDWRGLTDPLLQLDLPVDRMLRRTACSCGLRRPEHGVALDGHAVGAFDGAQAGGYASFAGGDGLAVAAAVGAFGQGLAVAFDFADVGLASFDSIQIMTARCQQRAD